MFYSSVCSIFKDEDLFSLRAISHSRGITYSFDSCSKLLSVTGCKRTPVLCKRTTVLMVITRVDQIVSIIIIFPRMFYCRLCSKIVCFNIYVFACTLIDLLKCNTNVNNMRFSELNQSVSWNYCTRY